MKQFRILAHSENPSVIVNANSLEFNDYLMASYFVIYEGNKRECLCFMELIESDGALSD